MLRPRKRMGLSTEVVQGARVLGQVSGRHAVLYDSLKAGGIIVVESASERTTAQHADLDPRVARLLPQPFTLDVTSGQFFDSRAARRAARDTRDDTEDARRYYTPDFRLDGHAGRRIIVEVKDPRYPGDDGYHRKLEEARALLLANGYEFLLFMLRYDQQDPVVFNANLLTSARYSDVGPLDMHHIQDALEKSLGDDTAPLGEVIREVELTMREAPYLFLGAILTADLQVHCLSAKTPVRLAWGQLDHFQVLPL